MCVCVCVCYVMCNSVITFGKRSILDVVGLTLYYANVFLMLLLIIYKWQVTILSLYFNHVQFQNIIFLN
jgi:hypothetical protein